MKSIGIAAAALAFAGAATAFAQTEAQSQRGGVSDMDMLKAPVRAPRQAFELGVATGYTQGFGNVYPGRPVGDVANAGVTAGIGLGYRVSPGFSIGATGQYQGYNASNVLPRGTTTRGAAAGVEGTFHLAPYDRVDPYVSVGAGYRMLWERPEGDAPSTLTHGFELGKVQVGLDLRASEGVAISPVIGADVNMFMWRAGEGAEPTALSRRGLSTFVFAGLEGRFDLGGARELKPEQVGSR